jgi:TfoX/Sxy family transcriptional regulator of competence genes
MRRMAPPAAKGMKFPKPSEEAKAAFTKMVPDEPAVNLKPMFGQLSAFVNGNMFCFLWGDDLLVRVPDADLAALKKQGGKDFSPMPGRTGMSGYVTVPGGWRAKTADALIKKALMHTRAMPAKAPKKKSAAKKR